MAYWPDAGTAGSKTVGLSGPVGQTYSIVAVEIKGAAGGTTNGTASPAGAGSITANITHSVTDSPTGAGALSAKITHSVTASLVGAGAVNASGSSSGASGSTINAAAALVGTGSLSATGLRSGTALTDEQAFDLAMSNYSGVWLPPKMFADWDGDGYGAAGSLDDLSQVAGAIKVAHAFDDGMPSDVSFTSDSDPVSNAGTDLAGRGGLSPREYWSPFNPDSPVYAYERDIAPITIDHGAVTETGPQYARIFTGAMGDTPISGTSVSLEATSATRRALSASVQPPPILGEWFGLNATWPVSWTLAQCGIYTSPPPRDGCRLWMPMHGSVFPFFPATGWPRSGNGSLPIYRDFQDDSRVVSPEFVDGPYVQGLYGSLNAEDAIRNLVTFAPVGPGEDLLSQRASAGRVEFWVRCDASDVNSTPTASGSFTWPPHVIVDVIATGPLALGGVDGNRKPYVRVKDDAGHDTTLTAATALPSDGQWHFVGFAWDVAGQKAWVNNDGVVTSANLSSHVTTSLPTSNNFDMFTEPSQTQNSRLSIATYLPIAELQVTAGAQANVDNYPTWINEASYWDPDTKLADIRPSVLNLVGLGELAAREAWEYISSFAQAELALTRTTEHDEFAYYPLPWLVEDEQQTTSEALSTSVNMDDSLTLKKDPSTIRNQVTVNYLLAIAQGTEFSYGNQTTIHDDFTQRTLPPGITTFTMPTDIATVNVECSLGYFGVLGASDSVAVRRPYICANTAIDGSGTDATDTDLFVRVTSFTASDVTVEVSNVSGATFYTVNNQNLPYIHIIGTALVTGQTSHVAESADSIAVRGVRGLTLDAPAIQDDETAARVASELVARLSRARVSATGTVRGDPRRKPGDLVTLADPTGTKASGAWRLFTVEHDIDGASYTQAITATQAAPVGVWGESTWGDCLWGP
ncbi:MAG TPA: hypothetical protein VHA75_11510 [Rugosimonospora sp.]|nr:hypothetical protein [Rugosimonospora sp.]